MPRPNEPEMRPESRGTRVHLADMEPGDVIDHWHKRSGGFFLRENLKVVDIRENGHVVFHTGLVMYQDVGWGESRRTSKEN